jgi:hypothetical protein
MISQLNEDWILAPHMLEASYLYNKASQLMWSHSISISIVNAALSLEILFKSFHAQVTGNENELNEKYSFNSKVLNKGENPHDLLHLFNALPENIKSQFNSSFTVDILTKYRSTFVGERYIYELSAIGGGTGALMDIANRLIDKTVQIYRKRGCTDPWVVNYPNV